MRNFLRLLLFCLITSASQAQCFQIESILVDACGPQEGLNEMVRFRVGNAPLNTSNLSVDWPNNSWQGLTQNATTVQKVAALNADILDAGGCGQLIQPTAGVLPANASVILVTSFNIDTALNEFGPITENIYILFQNNPAVATGHFANFGSGLRTLLMSFGSCSDSVTYDRALLINEAGVQTAGDGATVLFTPAGVATYVNNGCSAPVPPFTVEAGNALSACAGTSVSLVGSAQNQTSVQWTASSGTFSNASALNTTYTISPTATGTVTLTLTATNICGATISDTVTIAISASATPNFPATLTLCQGSVAPVLATTSPNGIVGTWNPSIINNQTSATYTFTPNAGQCAVATTLSVTINNSVTPNFATTLALCQGSVAPILATTSPNGIVGTWNPSTVNNQTSGTYVFTPNAGQCATSVTLAVTVNAGNVVPNFATTLALCQGSVAPVLATTSPNGIVGTWNPSIINNQTSGTYVFTPNAGQCATSVTLAVTVNAGNVVPNFATTLTLCQGSVAPILATTSPNGIVGTWNPSTVNNQTSGTYTFTPNAGQCAVTVTLAVSVTNAIVPDFATQLSICTGASVPTLDAISPNGISGTWNPAAIDNQNAGNYVFTPDAGQCAHPTTLTVTIVNPDVSISGACRGGSFVLEANSQNAADISSYEWTDASGAVVGSSEDLNASDILSGSNVTFPVVFTLTVTFDSGCTASDNYSVNTIFCTIPKGVSANGDGMNDAFNLSGLNVRELKIFNRYGSEVYSKRDYVNEWKGQSDNGDELPSATYYYALTTSDGTVKTGWVYLIRKS
ncbi:gliding motility-associated C-terminal domain-containing protein [Flavobacterium sp.]|uniref:T9SS type B sorting domain-containing protein n=1 Tax=Flavobacterium sp. TaxID=239 RepID=UPI00120FE9FE|nr:gliding motility-associated C-terminal domain-containing protein [Flavobacterium sp.]RZJ70401.1 MAG: T9SS type B sorting domain-containing protein [Flavobacterium sp.]